MLLRVLSVMYLSYGEERAERGGAEGDCLSVRFESRSPGSYGREVGYKDCTKTYFFRVGNGAVG